MKNVQSHLPRPKMRSPRRARLCTAASMWAFAAAPAAFGQTPLLNQYNLEALAPPYEITLTSSVSCGSVRCDIAYSILSQPLDRYVQIVWKDANGAPLVSGSNAYLSNFYSPQLFDGYVEATEFSKGAPGSAIAPSLIKTDVGTADFTGTGPGSDPCGTGYVCDDADYHYFPASAFAPAPAGAPRAGLRVTRLAAANEPVPIGTITGTLASIFVDPEHPEDVGDRRIPFIEFASSVAFGGGQYLYRYSVTNSTDRTIPFDWAEAGLEGELQPFGNMQRELTTAAAPGVASSLPQWTLRTDPPFPITQEFASTLEMYAPVPEPTEWLQLAFGLALLGGLRWRSRRR